MMARKLMGNGREEDDLSNADSDEEIHPIKYVDSDDDSDDEISPIKRVDSTRDMGAVTPSAAAEDVDDEVLPTLKRQNAGLTSSASVDAGHKDGMLKTLSGAKTDLA